MIEVRRPPFKLYPQERHWWSFNDYGAVLGVMDALKPARVLEFGPGSSTLALLEGGAAHIDCLEDHPDWFRTYRTRLEDKYPEVVRLHRYWTDPQLKLPALDVEPYDLALVDGPFCSERRHGVIEFALTRSRALLVPTEEVGSRTRGLRPVLEGLAVKYQRPLQYIDSGPLSGAFGLFPATPPPAAPAASPLSNGRRRKG